MSTATATGTRPYARSASPAGPARALQRTPAAAVRPGSRRPRVHLTRRGRLLVLLALVALLLAAFAFGRSASHASVNAESGAATLTQVTVQPGDTLWTVSRRLAPHRDPREVVEQLQELNQLPSSALQAGQQLLLPLAV